MTATDVAPVEFIYGIDDGTESNNFTPSIVALRVVKKTQKRIYYVRHHPWALHHAWALHPDDEKIGFVDRQAIETAGSAGVWARKTGRWWQTDAHLYLDPPTLPEWPTREAIVARLKAEMAAVHPDRGGTDAEFIAAHARYIRAREAVTS